MSDVEPDAALGVPAGALPTDPAAPQAAPAKELGETAPPSAAPESTSNLPAWYPAWARELADLYFSGTTCVFVLHGNVHDFIYGEDENGDGGTWTSLSEFLATRLFGRWEVVFNYDLGHGLRPYAGGDKARYAKMVTLTQPMGEPARWPRSPDKVFILLERFIRRVLLRDGDPTRTWPTSVATIFPHGQYLVPAADIASLSHTGGARLVQLLEWARNPILRKKNIAFCVIVDKLSEVNTRLVQNPYVATIEVPMPDGAERERFARWAVGDSDTFASHSAFTPEQIATMSNGLNLVDLNVVLAQARTGSRKIDAGRFGLLKKDLIERQCQGLLEFFEPNYDLDMVVGHEAAKERLRGDANLISQGRLDFAPMGYLICGPVGTGKTFLAECYAGSIGIPCVKLRNFRSKYVGETEGNLEHVLNVLRSLGPVVVIIDEADAALGTREDGGDSGTSSRVFSMIASQMGDTRYRGKIVWMLLTSRPDRLPVDLKRQGRAEVHIPLFYPRDEAEFQAMFRVMSRKNKIDLAEGASGHLAPGTQNLSGSDIESVVLSANRRALQEGRTQVRAADLDAALGDFMPSVQGLEREAQELAGVLECTQRTFLPESWRAQVSKPNGRAAIQERFVAIRQILDE